MGIITRSSKLWALATALSLSFAANNASGQEGYHDVRVNTDNVACGTVVLKWPLGDPRNAADLQAAEGRLPPPPKPLTDPNAKLEMAEVTPVPVIHAHPGLNAGTYWLPPADGVYRHYSPELQPPPPMWLYNRAVYERRLKEKYNIDYQVPPGSVGQFQPGQLGPVGAVGQAGPVAVAPGTVVPGMYVIQNGRQVFVPVGTAMAPAAAPQTQAKAPAEPARRVTAVQPKVTGSQPTTAAAGTNQATGEPAAEKEGAPISLPCPNFVLFGIPCGVEGPALVAPCTGAGPCGQIMPNGQGGATFGDWVSSPMANNFPPVVDVYEPKDATSAP